ncbi:MAG: hypothetical protein EP343_10005 [Deltaproteobacteria bacterium]|nr:MAG: hypothetical protein EP343_10005 [Deltaproteobacteria bacterium]
MEDRTSFVLSHYATDQVGTWKQSQPIEVGLIHGTYKIETSLATFCLQRLHPKLATDGILQDYQVVTDHVAKHNFPAPQLVPTSQGNLSFDDEDGSRWRLTTWLEGENTSTIRSLAMVRSAAEMFGEFHNLMQGLEYTFQSSHPLHDTQHHLRNLRDAVNEHKSNSWFKKIEPMIEWVEEKLPPILLPDDLPTCVVHGDPKISNLLFNAEDQAIALLDMDTCTRHTPLVDLGDAVRAWCCLKDKNGDVGFAIDRYEAIIEGYAEMGPRMEAANLERLHVAGLLITLELAARFLADTLQDSYFAWDSSTYSSRSEHNADRAQTMVTFSQKLEEALPQQRKIVDAIFAQTS